MVVAPDPMPPRMRYPFRVDLAGFNSRDQAWEYAREVAAVLVRLGLTPQWGVRTIPVIIPGKARWWRVEMGGPRPLDSHERERLSARVGAIL